jgi:hypothetical protein
LGREWREGWTSTVGLAEISTTKGTKDIMPHPAKKALSHARRDATKSLKLKTDD